MSVSSASTQPDVALRREADALIVTAGGRWRLTEPRPAWKAPTGEPPKRVRVEMDADTQWDSSVVLYFFRVCQWTRVIGAYFDKSALPEPVQDLLSKMESARETCVPFDRAPNFVVELGTVAIGAWNRKREINRFVGQVLLSALRLLRQPQKFRARDCLYEMQACGAMALPIVGLIAFLVGLTLAYTGAVVLRQFGADIWVADLVGLTMTREMGAVMTAIVLAGRTGAAFAATLGNMKANEEIDALQTLGVRPVDFLVMPRIVALGLMMPLLALYANAMGIIGGMAVSRTVLDIPPVAYWVETLTIVDLSDMMTGLIKAFTFGIIVGIAGCLRGLQAERSAAGVGKAATSAVVTAILFIIIADAAYAIIFDFLGW